MRKSYLVNKVELNSKMFWGNIIQDVAVRNLSMGKYNELINDYEIKDINVRHTTDEEEGTVLPYSVNVTLECNYDEDTEISISFKVVEYDDECGFATLQMRRVRFS